MPNEQLKTNINVAANSIELSNAVINELAGNGLDGNEVKELEEAFALEINNLIMEKVQ